MKPTITIIMATYNREHFILEMLNSISVQTFKAWECLIIDDGGTDNTEEVISNLLKEDNRFKYIKRTKKYKKGLCGSRNCGLDLAKGDYIIFFDDDDMVHSNILEIAHNEIKKNKVEFCHYQKQSFFKEKPKFQNTKTEIIDLIDKTNLKDIVTGKIGLASCTVLWKKECFSKIRFNEDLHYAEEWECYIKIISNGFKGIIIKDVLYFNRKHQNSNTGEFYNINPIRVESYINAILLVLDNLKEKKLISKSIIHYFVQISANYKEYNLFNKICAKLNFSKFQKLKWTVFKKTLPLRLYFYRIFKRSSQR
ncbi:glycosyltransferase family 2 protein [Lacinutrix sp. MedPE-SW]|uniref:glycosyltransferase family 2 protein n=1 Tax=Lacinutrix sp. MedPE-SW TaxID=1860087 RepID=UPI00090F5560|nr:glycosyltransferase family 2 protein [Lacinutrix sp. MedPE-SW]OIQ22722.1 MAG: hypothetical protein BM549_06485 [Lacinutrix sp. MedPE-SW]